jgi:rifampicin phosphotransferase
MNPTDMLHSIILLDWKEAARLGPGVAGGKGAQLGRLARYGLPVADGCVVQADVYRAAMAGNLHEAALGACALAEDARNAGLEKLRNRMLEQPLPPALSMALDDLLESKAWHDQPLAVRSSAPAEDSAQASFAGIHHSVLNVIGRAALADAIGAVWASLWTSQAVAYRERIGMRHEDAAMAVVVMPMIPAKASGVVFTCDPRSGREDRMVISAVRGLGEALVSGLVSGEDIVLARGDGRLGEVCAVIERRPASASLALEPDAAGGVNQRNLTQEERSVPVLDDAQAAALGALAWDAANAFDFSAPWYDIEWVWDGSRFHLVQARPITVRPWHTYPALQGQASIWTNGNSRDVMPHVIDACEFQGLKSHANFLMQGVYRLVGFPILDGAQRAALFQGRLYFNASIMQWESYDGFGIAPHMFNRSMGGHQPKILAPALTLRQKLNHIARMLRFLVKSPAMRRQGLAESQRVVAESREWRKTNLSTLTNQALIDRINSLAASYLLRHPGLAFMQCAGGSSLELLKRLDLKFSDESYSLAAALMAGGTPSVTAQQGYDLLRLASLAHKEPLVTQWLRAGHGGDWRALPPDSGFRAGFADFLERYGHRGVYESYLRSPRWREDPSYLLASIAGLLDADIQDIHRRQQQSLTSAWQHIATRTSWAERSTIRLLQRWSSRDNNHRELARTSFTAIYEWIRLVLLEIGRRLVADGLLNQRDEVFHLTYAEHAGALSGALPRAAIQARVADRIKMAEYWDVNPAPDVVIEGGNGAAVAPAPEFEVAADTWCGVAVGSGYIQGKVRIVNHPNEHARLQRGEILVAPSTDPSWVPLFLKAGGLIMETGGYLSHGAIVAREFGIPAVVNLPGIMAQLRDGDMVAVDGQRGMVIRLGGGELDKVFLQKQL